MSSSSSDPRGWLPDYFARVEDPGDRERPIRRRTWPLAGVAASAFGLPFCLTLLWFGMRTIMATEGGFVAVGGPYEIAHPAPDWVWIMPVSVILGMGFGALNGISAHMAEGFDLIIPAWSATFLSLGWNFAEFGLGLRGGGPAWGWIVCAVVFIPMGAIPLWGLAKGWNMVGSFSTAPRGSGPGQEPRTPGAVYALLHVVAIPAGILAAWAFFRAIAG